MLKYADLTKGQKRCIDAFVERYPELASAETICTKDIQKIFWEVHGTRAAGAPKIGYPLWISKNNQVARGVHAFPGPQSTGDQTELAKSKLQKILDGSDSVEVESNNEEFLAELRANGITV